MALRFVAVLIAALFLGQLQAFAHSALATSAPQNGAQLSETPSEFILKFKAPVQITVTQLTDAAGGGVELRAPDMSEGITEYRAPLPPLAAGAYVLEWRAISDDGHDIGGKIKFSVGQ